MAKNRYINTVFWNDNYVVDLDPSEKLIFIYLITNPHTNISGVYQLPLKTIAVDTGIEKDMCKKILDRFIKDKKIIYSDGWIAIMNFLKHQNYNSPQVQIAIENELKNVPDTVSIPYQQVLDTLHINISLIKLNKDKGKNEILEKNVIPPTIEMVTNYCKERKNNIDPEQFINFYNSKGWMIGKNKMKDWQSAIYTWEKRDKDNKSEEPHKPRIKAKNGKFYNEQGEEVHI